MAKKTENFVSFMETELANDAELNTLFQQELVRLKLANQIAVARQKHGLSQQALAKRVGTTQSAIARMERADYTGYTLTSLAKIAVATGMSLNVGFTPIKVATKR